MWREILIELGIRASDIDARRVGPGQLSDALESAQFPADVIADAIRLFDTPGGRMKRKTKKDMAAEPIPAASKTRVKRVEILAERVEKQVRLYHAGDDIRGMNVSTKRLALAARRGRPLDDDGEYIDDDTDPVDLDEAPRRAMIEYREKKAREKREREGTDAAPVDSEHALSFAAAVA